MRKYRDNEKSGKLENFWWEVYHQLLWKRSMIIWRIIGKAIRLLYQCFKPSKYLMRVKFISDLSPSEDKPQEVGQLIAGIRPEFSTSWKWAFGLGNSECLRENIEKYCHSRSCRLCFISFSHFVEEVELLDAVRVVRNIEFQWKESVKLKISEYNSQDTEKYWMFLEAHKVCILKSVESFTRTVTAWWDGG